MHEEGELLVLRRLLTGHRLVTLHGPAGAGKTGLAWQAADAERLAGRWGVMWLAAGDATTERLTTVVAQLRDRLASRAMLLVLDGCEELGGEAGETVVGLLEQLPGLSLLITTRRRLYLPGEAAVLVGPLSAPEARRLFAGTAAVAGSPVPQAAEGTVAELCERTGLIAGAVVHAAARLGAEPLAAVAAEPLCSAHGRGPLVDAERSYRACDPTERLVWERLTVFGGSFDIPAVLAVCESDTLPGRELLIAFARLAPQVLLADDDGCYRMLPAPRAAGGPHLVARGDAGEVALRHRRHLAAAAAGAAELWALGRHAEAQALAGRLLPDVRTAVESDAESDAESAVGGPEGSSRVVVLDAVVSLWFLWGTGTSRAEGIRLARLALDAHTGPRRARGLWLIAHLLLCDGEVEGAQPHLARARPLAEAEGDRACLGRIAQSLGSSYIWYGHFAEAEPELREALVLLPDVPEFGPGRAMSVAMLALALVQRDPEAAMDVLTSSPDWTLSEKDSLAGAWTRIVLAEMGRWEGDSRRARRYAAQAVRRLADLGQDQAAEYAALLLVDIQLGLGEDREAARVLGAADSLAETGRPRTYDRTPLGRRRAWCEERLRLRLGEEELRRTAASGSAAGLRELAEAISRDD
ncbi:hypothetical protein [Streptomyces sp. NPDC055749]